MEKADRCGNMPALQYFLKLQYFGTLGSLSHTPFHRIQRDQVDMAIQTMQQIRQDLTITLAISLHAPNDVLRREMMPVANR